MNEGKWLLVFRYPNMDSAGEAYEVCRDLVFGLDIDASAYRIQLNTVPHVVIFGDSELLPPVRDMFERACTSGAPTDLPDDIANALFERRAAGKTPGAFWERRSQ